MRDGTRGTPTIIPLTYCTNPLKCSRGITPPSFLLAMEVKIDPASSLCLCFRRNKEGLPLFVIYGPFQTYKKARSGLFLVILVY